jgi:hypothetical protein
VSRYSGAQQAGAARRRREQARVEAAERDASAMPERRASFRRERLRIRAALNERERAALANALGVSQ